MKYKSGEPLPQTELVISAATFIKVVLLVVSTILTLSVLRLTAHSLVILFTAFFLALALNAPVSFLARHMPGRVRGSRAWGTTVAFIIVIVLLGGFIASLVPPLIRNTQNLASAAPGLIQSIRNQDGAVGEIVGRYNLQNQVDDLTSQLSSRLKSGASKAFSTFQSVGSSIFTTLTILVLTFMMLVEGPRQVRFMYELIPKQHKKVSANIAHDMYKVVKGYVNGQVTLAVLAAVAITPVFFIMDVSYPIGLMVIVFICGLIPLFGHTIGAAIVSVVALFTSPLAFVVVLSYYLIYQQLENIFIQPKIQANSTDMSPLLVFASVIVGVSFSGLLGGLVAIPVAGCIRVAALEYLRMRGNLQDKPVVKDEVHTATGKAT